MANSFSRAAPPVLYADTPGTALVDGEVRIQTVTVTAGTAAGQAIIRYGTGTSGAVLFNVKVAVGESHTLVLPEPLRVPALYADTLSGSAVAIFNLVPSDRAYN